MSETLTEVATPVETPADPHATQLLVISKVKAYVEDQEKRCSKDFLAAFSAHVQHLLDAAIDRADYNGRVTMRRSDV